VGEQSREGYWEARQRTLPEAREHCMYVCCTRYMYDYDDQIEQKKMGEACNAYEISVKESEWKI